MTSVRELAEKIESDRQLTEDLSAPIAGIKDELEGLAAQARALGIERVAGVLEQAKGSLEEAESSRVVLQGGLEKARWQVMSAVHGNIGPGAKGSGPGGSFIAADGKITTADGSPVNPHLDAVPPHLRQDPSPTGDELSGVDPSISPFQKEHENAEADRGMSKARRLGRGMVRSAGDIADYSKQTSSSTTFDLDDDYDPWGPSVQTTVEVPTGQPPVFFNRPEADDIRAGDVFSTTIVVAAFAVEALSRIGRKKDNG